MAALTADNDALEAALHSGAELPASATQPWHPPQLPPLPPELAPAAREVLARQVALQARLALDLAQLSPATRRRSVATAAPQPTLVDLRA
ncbi:hypothetical protein [Rhodococcus sp. X156]|uniref:hypothetical protein n=1 Tax=Rhodococcus sp. X156 TaxID=2499145 RepID=UPI000FDBF95B|nr:hypothetical protein [Rhodococcus sp. X156]